MDFARIIKQIRYQCLLSQKDFAAKLGVSFSTINRWEKGKTQPSFKTLRQIDEFCKKEHIEFNTGDFSMR